MIDYSHFYGQLKNKRLSAWQSALTGRLERHLLDAGHGDIPRWVGALEALPDIHPADINLGSDWVTIGSEEDCSDQQRETIEKNLRLLWPWRKGPFNLFGIKIDTEWRSDMKWDRVKNEIEPLDGRVVLDIGCGSGYHCWRMQAAGAQLVIGIEPTLVYVMQYHAMQKYIQSPVVHVLPYSTDTIPQINNAFDTVFSMGVLYHRRSPIDHLSDIKRWLHKDGQLVLETLVIDESEGQLLVPERRYAKMRNVWFIPSCTILETWLKRCGYKNIRCVDVNQTSTEEQRVTDWMHFESLQDFLDPENPNLTIEGLPAPRRAIYLANK